MSSDLKMPHPNEVHLWLADTEPTLPSLVNPELLSADEVNALSQFHFQRDRDCFLLTRTMLRTALSTYFPDVAARDWKFSKNKYGKPSLPEDQNRTPLSFNISHSHGKIICAFSTAPSLGVDLEMTQKHLPFLELAKTNFSEIECENLTTKAPDQLAAFFYRYWTLKESFIKAKGQGLSIPLNEFTFDFTNPTDIQIQFQGSLRGEKTEWRFQLFEPWPQYQAALSLSSDQPIESSVFLFCDMKRNEPNI